MISRTPGDGSAGVGTTSALIFTVSEPLSPSNVDASNVRVLANTGFGQFQLAGALTLDATRTIVTFTPAGPMPANTTIYWYTNYSGGITDLAGNVLSNGNAIITTGSAPDAVAPVVQMITPANGDAGLGPLTTTAITFSESLNPNTVNNTTFAWFANGVLIGSAVSRSIDNRIVYLSSGNLPLGATITVVVTGAQDLSGNTVADFESSFTTGAPYDFAQPSVIGQRPQGSGIDATTPVTLFMDSSLNTSTVPGALYVSQNGTLVGGSIAVTGAGRVIVFTPAAPFLPGAMVEVVLTPAARDLAGNHAYYYHGSFVVAPDLSGTPPTLINTNPAQVLSGAPQNAVVDLQFSTPLNPATVTAATVFVQGSDGVAIAGTLSLSNGNRNVRFTPAALLTQTFYYVYVQSGLQDTAGHSFVATQFYFYPGSSTDTTAPALVSLMPPAGSTGVGDNALLSAAFNEVINLATVNPSTVVLTGPGTTPIPFSLSVDGGNMRIVVTPQSALPDNTTITLQLNGIQDVAGNSAAPASTVFTTGPTVDTIRPSIVGASIASGETAVPVNAVFEFRADEPLNASTVAALTNQFLYDYSTGYVTGGTLSVIGGGMTIVYVPPAPLQTNHDYFVNLSTVIQDLAGNPLQNFTPSFHTSSVSDSTPPVMMAVTPGAGLINVPRNARMRVQFDEAVDGTTLGSVTLLRSGTPVAGMTVSLENGNRTLNLTLPALLQGASNYTISVAGVRDLAGNLMPTATSSFSTGTAVDLSYFGSQAVQTPLNGATGVPTSVAPTVLFDQPVDAVSVLNAGGSGIVLRVSATSVVVPVTFSFSADMRTVTLTPVTPLDAGTQYQVYISAGYSIWLGSTTSLAGRWSSRRAAEDLVPAKRSVQ